MNTAQFHFQIQMIQKKYDAIIQGLVSSQQTDQLPAVMAQYKAEIDAVTSAFEAPILQEVEELEMQIALDDKRMDEEEAKEASDPFFNDLEVSEEEPEDD